MDLNWQDILAELQGLDMQQDPTYDNADYVCQPPTVPHMGYNLGSYPRDSIIFNANHSLPSCSRMHMDPISSQAQHVGSLPLVSAYSPTSFTAMLSSNMTQVGAINHYPSKLVPASGMSTSEHAAMPEANLNPIHTLPQTWKIQEDFESDSGLSLNFSDGESIEIENTETYHMRSEYMELITPHAYPCQNPGAANIAPHLMENSIYETQTYITSRTQELVCSRDERRAAAMHIPFAIEKIINLPVEVFNELLSHYTLTESQMALIRDIRRRGKNKVAAQNCRKRKMENITILEREIEQLKEEREGLHREREEVDRIMKELKNNLNVLQEEVYGILQSQGNHSYQEDLLYKPAFDAGTSFPTK
ncbi:transcription factor NF-E2 45 kDa subunit [Gastrophryne carolinensis]